MLCLDGPYGPSFLKSLRAAKIERLRFDVLAFDIVTFRLIVVPFWRRQKPIKLGTTTSSVFFDRARTTPIVFTREPVP